LYPELSKLERDARSNIESAAFRNVQRVQRRQQGARIPALEDTYILRFSKDADMEEMPLSILRPQWSNMRALIISLGLLAEPNDPYWNSSGVGDSLTGISTGSISSIPEAPGYLSRGNVVVAVIDTGLDRDHEDLAGKVWTNSGEIPNNGIDDDGKRLCG